MINTKFWSDSYISNIDPLEKLLFLYFLTNPYTNICGIYELPLKQIALDTGIDRDNLEKVFLPRLKKAGKIYYIDGWVYIKNFRKHQKSSGNIEQGIKNGLEQVAPSILAKIKQFDNTPPTQGGHSPKLKPELEYKPEPKDICSTKLSETDFEAFWKSYPKRKAKQKAKAKFLKLDPTLIPEIMSALEAQKKTEQWTKDEGKFIPYPDTWLNGRRWEDEVCEKEQDKYSLLEKTISGKTKLFWNGISLSWFKSALNECYPDNMDFLQGQQAEDFRKVVDNYQEVIKFYESN